MVVCLGFPVLCIASAAYYVPRIEADLTDRSHEALSGQSIVIDDLTFDGRDALVTLTAGGPARSERAGATVRDVRGVRVATIDLREPDWKPTIIERRPPWLRLTVSDEYAELVGALPAGSDVEGLVAAVAGSLGGMTVREAVDESTGGSAAWLDAYRAAVHAARDGTMDLSFEVKGKRMRVFGYVPDAETRERVLAAARRDLVGFELDPQVTVRRSLATQTDAEDGAR